MSVLYGYPNQLIPQIGTLLMLDPIFSKLMYYSNNDEDDLLSLPDVDNPIKELKNNKVFYSRRVDKMLHEANISVYITLNDYRPITNNFKKSSYLGNTKLEIGVVCHNKCRDTINGLRDIAVLCRIVELICENEELKGVGKVELINIGSLYGMPVEYTGFKIIVSATNFL